jgi:hypothetical protein
MKGISVSPMKKCSIFVERSSTMEQSYDQPPPQKNGNGCQHAHYHTSAHMPPQRGNNNLDCFIKQTNFFI